ncbi:MAG: glutamine amidotransferase [Clostridia bacterium]|nr:glutamine amidotransferase [Clostridia bacterium]
MKIQIAHICPELLNLYGDRGNIASLLYRTQKRGIECDVREYSLGEMPDFEKSDIIFIGGGADKEQLMVCSELLNYKKEFKAYVEKGKVLVALCGGFELMGKCLKTPEGEFPCLDILDFYTEYEKERHIGNVIIESDILKTKIVGFENHSGKIIGDNFTPLGRVISGYGSYGNGYEGAIYKNLIASYLHGPLLPKNPTLCDYIIKKALENKYGEVSLEALDDTFENAAHSYILNKFGK